jgi:hypothetical protein
MSRVTCSEAVQESSDPWVVVNYELDMLNNMCELLIEGNDEYARFSSHLRNAVVESAVLHTRNLLELLISKGGDPDDILLSSLMPTFGSKTVEKLRRAYGDRKTVDSPCWAFNKKLAHSTLGRTDSYDYTPHLKTILPLIQELMSEIRANQRAGGTGRM